MGWVRGNGEVRVWLTVGLALTCGCASGEGNSVGNISRTAGLPQDETSTGAITSGTEAESTANETETTSGPATSSTDPTIDPSTTTVDPTASTTSPPQACMFATACDDADPCTEDNCINSVCVNEPLDCDDGFDCTIDSCNTNGSCVHETDDEACSDADLCNGAETCTADAGCQAGTPVTCSDGESCTADSCEPSTGTCEFDEIDACSGSDGCCPLGCSVAADNDCTCNNLTAGATASSSGGGGGDYGPEAWIDGVDESSCNSSCTTSCFGWLTNSSTPNGAFLQLEWPAAQTIGSMHIDTVGGPSGVCDNARVLSGGTVRYWSEGAWVNAATFSGESGNFTLNFNPPFTTTRVQIYDAVTSGTVLHSIVFEWYVYEPLGCAP